MSFESRNAHGFVFIFPQPQMCICSSSDSTWRHAPKLLPASLERTSLLSLSMHDEAAGTPSSHHRIHVSTHAGIGVLARSNLVTSLSSLSMNDERRKPPILTSPLLPFKRILPQLRSPVRYNGYNSQAVIIHKSDTKMREMVVAAQAGRGGYTVQIASG